MTQSSSLPAGATGPALEQLEQAKAVCQRCKVIDQCLAWALATGQDAGVWGGLSNTRFIAWLGGAPEVYVLARNLDRLAGVAAESREDPHASGNWPGAVPSAGSVRIASRPAEARLDARRAAVSELSCPTFPTKARAGSATGSRRPDNALWRTCSDRRMSWPVSLPSRRGGLMTRVAAT